MSRREFILLLAVGVDTAAWKTVKTWRDGITKLPADDQTRLIIEGLRGSYATKDFASPAAAKTAVVAGFRKTISAFGRAALEGAHGLRIYHGADLSGSRCRRAADDDSRNLASRITRRQSHGHES
jgi:hypothetical protein